MSSEIIEYLLTNRHEKLNNYKMVKTVAKFMKKQYPDESYDFQSSVHIHVGYTPKTNKYSQLCEPIHLLIITNCKLFMTIVISHSIYFNLYRKISISYGISCSWLFECDENIANEAIEYFSNCNYVFNYDDVVEKTKLVPIEGGLLIDTTFADFIPRSTKSSRS